MPDNSTPTWTPPSGWKQTGPDEWHHGCPVAGGGDDGCWIQPERRRIGCRPCSADGSGRLDKEQFKAHAQALGFDIQPAARAKRPRRWTESWTYTTAAGKTRKQGRLTAAAAEKFGRRKEWSKPTAGTPEPADLLYVPAPSTTRGRAVVCEGGSSTDALIRLGTNAIGHPGATPTAESCGRFAGKVSEFLLWPDVDPDMAGYRQAVRVGRAFEAAGFKVRAVDPLKLNPTAADGWDPADWTPAEGADPKDAIMGAAVELADIEARCPKVDPAPAGDGFPAAVSAALENLAAAGLGAVSARVSALAEAVDGAALDKAGRAAVKSAAIGRLKDRLSVGAQEARDILAGLDSGARDDLAGGALSWPKVDPAPEPAPLAGILDRLVGELRRFMHLPNGAAEVVAVWIAWTYVEPRSQILPMLAVTSPVKGCGKTTLLDVVQAFVERPFSAPTATPAALFRVVEAHHPVLLLDEADNWLKAKGEGAGDRLAILNGGHRRGGSVPRCVGDNHEVRTFRVDAPKAIAGIGDYLTDTLADRSIIVTLERKPSTVRLESFRLDRRPAPELRGELKRWAADHGDEYAAHDPRMGALENRQADNWRPLYGLADVAGRQWSTRIRSAAVKVTGRADKRTTGAASYPEMLLLDCREVFDAAGVDRMLSKDLDAGLHALEDRPWAAMGRTGKPLTPQGRGRYLRAFGVLSAKLHPENLNGYLRADFADAWSTYGTPPTEPDRPDEPDGVDPDTSGSSGSSGSSRGIPTLDETTPTPAYVMAAAAPPDPAADKPLTDPPAQPHTDHIEGPLGPPVLPAAPKGETMGEHMRRMNDAVRAKMRAKAERYITIAKRTAPDDPLLAPLLDIGVALDACDVVALHTAHQRFCRMVSDNTQGES